MKLFLNRLLFCIVAALSLNAAFADGTPAGLTVSCSVLDNHFPIAANVPIWLDVKVTNSGTVTFTGLDLGDPTNYGAIVTTSPVTNDLLNKAVPLAMDMICLGFSIAPGGQQDFHVLLNDYFPDLHAGLMSGSVIVPIDSRSGTGWFTLVAPFKVNIAPPLTAEQMKPLCDAFGKRIIASRPEDQEIIHSDNALPDEYAVPMLLQIIKEKPPLPSAIDCLGQRPRTPETEKALQFLANSSDPFQKKLANSYLSK